MLHSELPACDVRTLGMIRPLLPVCLLLAIAAAPQGQSRPPAAQTARQLQQKYDQVKDFTADFTHTYEGGVLKKKSTAGLVCSSQEASWQASIGFRTSRRGARLVS